VALHTGIEETPYQMDTIHVPLVNLNVDYFNQYFPGHQRDVYPTHEPFQAYVSDRRQRLGGIHIAPKKSKEAETELIKIISYQKLIHAWKNAVESRVETAPRNFVGMRRSRIFMVTMAEALSKQAAATSIIRYEFRLKFQGTLKVTTYLMYQYLGLLRKCLVVQPSPPYFQGRVSTPVSSPSRASCSRRVSPLVQPRRWSHDGALVAPDDN
jgi:hypothetical protein